MRCHYTIISAIFDLELRSSIGPFDMASAKLEGGQCSKSPDASWWIHCPSIRQWAAIELVKVATPLSTPPDSPKPEPWLRYSGG
jgi:hypothetical protein